MQEMMLELVEQLIDDKPVLRQTMLYFKPPGGRGQALHQDEQYITIEPVDWCLGGVGQIGQICWADGSRPRFT